MLFREDLGLPGDEPENLFLITDTPALADVAEAVGNVVALALTAALAVVLVRRWRNWSPLARRSLTPVLLTGAVLAGGLAFVALLDIAGVSDDVLDVVYVVPLAALVALPFAFLAGLGRLRYTRAGAVTALVERLNAPERRLRDALADALGDPSLCLAYRRTGRDEFVDAEGHPYVLPETGVTLLEREGEVLGALVHDPALDEDPDLIRAAAGAAALALDNERLAAELRARVAEVEESRERLLVAGLTERRRLERDLHDGAQQRLVALALQLGLARARVERDPQGAAELLDAARGELAQALEELRELARGIHPALLTDRGLKPALEALADRAPVPVALDDVPQERFPAAIEAAAYFVVAESLTNVAKYADAQEAHVRVLRRNGHAIVEVADDGRGGAQADRGSGLRGLSDRLAALDGRLEVQSPPGEGTVVRATIPCGS
jgi:signal transduction histidine kinase